MWPKRQLGPPLQVVDPTSCYKCTPVPFFFWVLFCLLFWAPPPIIPTYPNYIVWGPPPSYSPCYRPRVKPSFSSTCSLLIGLFLRTCSDTVYLPADRESEEGAESTVHYRSGFHVTLHVACCQNRNDYRHHRSRSNHLECQRLIFLNVIIYDCINLVIN